MEGAEPEDIKQAFISGDLSADEKKSIATAMEKLKTCKVWTIFANVYRNLRSYYNRKLDNCARN